MNRASGSAAFIALIGSIGLLLELMLLLLALASMTVSAIIVWLGKQVDSAESIAGNLKDGGRFFNDLLLRE
jgi:hypothetical protein